MRRTATMNRGVSVLYFMGVLAVVAILSQVLLSLALDTYVRGQQLRQRFECLQLAESGVQLFLYNLNHKNKGPETIDSYEMGRGSFRVEIIKEQPLTIKSTGVVPAERPQFQYSVTAVLESTAEGYGVAYVSY